MSQEQIPLFDEAFDDPSFHGGVLLADVSYETAESFPGEGERSLFYPTLQGDDDFTGVGMAITGRDGEFSSVRESLVVASEMVGPNVGYKEPIPRNRLATPLGAAVTMLRQVSASDHREAMRYQELGDTRMALRLAKRAVDVDPANEGAAKFMHWLAQRTGPATLLSEKHWKTEEPTVLVRFSPDGDLVYSANTAGDLTCWRGKTGVVLWTAEHGEEISHLALSENGAWVATGGVSGQVKVWSAQNGALKDRVLSHRGAVSSLDFSEDGEVLLTSSVDGSVSIWESASGLPLFGPWQPGSSVLGATFGAGDDWFLAWTEDGSATVWGWRNDQLLGGIGHGDSVWTAALHPNDSLIATGSADQYLKVWDRKTGGLVLDANLGDPAFQLSFTPDGKTLVVVTQRGEIRFWSTTDWREREDFLQLTRSLESVEVSPDGRQLLLLSGGVELLDLETLQMVRQVEARDDDFHEAHFHPDGSQFVIGGEQGALRLFSTAAGSAFWEDTPLPTTLDHVLISEDGAWLAGWDSGQSRTRVWPLSDRGEVGEASFLYQGKPLSFARGGREILMESPGGGGMAIHRIGTPESTRFQGPDGEFVASVLGTNKAAAFLDGRGRLALEWPAEGHQQSQDTFLDSGAEMGLWPGGRGDLALVSVGNRSKLVSLSSGEVLWGPSAGAGGILSAAMDPLGNVFCLGRRTGILDLWTRTGKRGAPLESHFSPITDVTFSSDGEWVSTSSIDGEVRVSSVADGSFRSRPFVLDLPAEETLFRQDGRELMVQKGDRVLQIWDTTSGRALTGPMEVPGALQGMAMSLDGLSTLVVSGEPGLLRLPVLDDELGKRIPTWMEEVVQLGSGLLQSPDGVFEPLHWEEVRWVREFLEGGAVEESSVWKPLAEWLLASPRSRPIHVGSEETVTAYLWDLVKRVGESGGAGLAAEVAWAHRLDPAFPLIHLALARTESGEAASFLRRFDVERLPESCHYSDSLDAEEVLRVALRLCEIQDDRMLAAVVREKLRSL
ncbi:MAG: WD40 repeat domain-containing protein [Verrucomicrobiota bacterium]